MSIRNAIGIDLGGTQIKGLVVTSAGRVLAEIATPTEGSHPTRWRKNVGNAVAVLQKQAAGADYVIGVAAPGLPSRDGRSIAYMPGRLPGLESLVWKDLLKSPSPVPVLNDAQAALLGELWIGAARGYRDALLLTIGTGVGGAAVVNGALLKGHIGRAGHFGHVSLDPNGSPDVTNCPGSLEDAIGDCTVKIRTGGRFESTQALVTAARAGDAKAKQVWLASVQALGAAIASLVNVLDPEVVVIGGGIAKAKGFLFRPLARFLSRYEWRPGGHKVRIVPAALDDRAGAFGAAWNALNEAQAL